MLSNTKKPEKELSLQHQLVSNERRFRSLVENSTDGIAIISKDAKIKYTSPSAPNILGYTAEEIMKMDALSTVHPEDLLLVHQALEIALANPGKPGKGFTVRVLHKDRSWRWVEATLTNMLNDPAIEGIVDNFRDVTERKLAEQALRESEEQLKLFKERYETIARATNDVIYEWDIIKNVNYWGEGYETLFGHKRTGDVMPTDTWVNNLHPDEKEGLFASVHEAFSQKKTSLIRELRFRCADGSYKTVLDKLVIVYDQEEKPIRIVGAMQDITERKKHETSIINLNEELNKRAEELAASNAELEQFAYVASHDLQEPLRMITSFLQLLENKYEKDLDETAMQYIQYSVEGAGRMRSLILDLLEYSRVNTSQEQRVSYQCQ